MEFELEASLDLVVDDRGYRISSVGVCGGRDGCLERPPTQDSGGTVNGSSELSLEEEAASGFVGCRISTEGMGWIRGPLMVGSCGDRARRRSSVEPRRRW